MPKQLGRRRTPLFRRRRVIFAAMVVAVALGFLAYMLVSQFSTYYLTVSEFREKGDSVNGKQLRVGGHIVTESVNWDTENVTLSFTLAEGEARLPIVYKGAVPDTFRADSDIIVEGKVNPQGVFVATKLITKCPSKYEPSE